MKEIDNKLFLKKINILEVVKSFLDLKKKGRNYLGLCPFHKDNHPSFFVSESKQIFKCFSCGIGGNAINFIMNYENLTWKKAVLWIAEKFDIFLSEDFQQTTEMSNEAKEMLKINEEGNIFFQINLLNEEKSLVTQYCQKRNINEQILEKFKIGWMDDNDEKILEYFTKKNISQIQLINSQLFIWQKTKKIKCYFKNRLIFPIFNEEGHLVGFSGRKIIDLPENKEGEIKYVNSRDSVLFKKNNVLYNFHYITQHFKTIKTIYLVEGFLDSIRMIMHKYPAVSLMGTVLSQIQIDLIKERYKEVIIFPDYDFAGIKSAIKNALFLIQNKINVLIVEHQGQKDPDLCFQEKNFDFNQTQKSHPVEFIINKTNQKLNPANTKKFFTTIKQFWPWLSSIEQYQFIKKISVKFEIPEKIINMEFGYKPQTVKNINPKKNTFVPTEEAWKKLLLVNLLFQPELIEESIKIDGVFNNEELDFYYSLLISWKQQIKNQNKLNLQNFKDFTQNTKHKFWLENFVKEHEQKLECKNINLKVFNNYLKMFRQEKLKLEIKELDEVLLNETNLIKKKEILKKIQKKSTEKVNL